MDEDGFRFWRSAQVDHGGDLALCCADAKQYRCGTWHAAGGDAGIDLDQSDCTGDGGCLGQSGRPICDQKRGCFGCRIETVAGGIQNDDGTWCGWVSRGVDRAVLISSGEEKTGVSGDYGYAEFVAAFAIAQHPHHGNSGSKFNRPV